MNRTLLALVLAAAAPARADEAPSVEATAAPDDLDLRLTLSTFLYRETGDDAAALVDQGATAANASPVQRTFGDLRMELTSGGLFADGRVRQTTSQRFQAGANGASEYDLRTLGYRLGGERMSLTIGRQYLDSVGQTKIDGLAFRRAIAGPVAATLFAGAYPQLGSRSLDTDYVRIDGSRIVPVSGGLGVDYATPDFHGAVGLAGVYVAQEVAGASFDERSRVFATSTGYWRPASIVDVYHFALVDVAGGEGVALTNGSAGLVLRPLPALQITASASHVGIDVLQLTARDLLADPDPTVIGLVQNDVALVRVAQESARAGATLALAAQRFEISASAGAHRRPEVRVPLSDGTGDVLFAETRSLDATFGVVDRRSLGGARIALTGTLAAPLGDAVPNRAKSTAVRLAIGRAFAHERGQLEVDGMAARFSSASSSGMCTASMDPFVCYSAAKATVAQAGVLASWRVGREWLLIADAHAGYRDATSQTIAGTTAWPHVWAITSFLRAQWRYH